MKCPETPTGLRNKGGFLLERIDNAATTYGKTIETELPFENVIDGGSVAP